MDDILRRQGRAPTGGDGDSLRDLGFRSIDFSELALRVEDEADSELSFDAGALRAIETVADVLDFFDEALAADGTL